MKRTRTTLNTRVLNPSRLILICLPLLTGMTGMLKAESAAEKLLELDRTIVIGHRGYPTIAPENTIPGFELAKLAGADLVELDYHISREGKAIVIHDYTLDRTTDAVKAWGVEDLKVVEKSIKEMKVLDAGSWYASRYAGVHLPTLEEALDVIQEDGGMTLIERKAGGADHIVKLLHDKQLINEVILQAFDWQFLKDVHALEPEQILGALGPQKTWKGKKVSKNDRDLSPKWIDEVLKTGAQVVGWNGGVNREAIDYAHEKGLKVLVYTINDLETAQELIHMGVDGIITNNTAVIWKAIALLGSE